MSSDHAAAATTNKLEQFMIYPFDTDQTYQQGLASILTGNVPSNDSPSPYEHEELLLRIKVFYFNKATGSSITVDQVKTYEQSLNQQDVELGSLPSIISAPVETTTTTTATTSPTTDNPQILSFAEIKALIESGRLDEIPNNKIIPDSLNEENLSESMASARKKPWEIASENRSDSCEGMEA